MDSILSVFATSRKVRLLCIRLTTVTRTGTDKNWGDGCTQPCSDGKLHNLRALTFTIVGTDSCPERKDTLQPVSMCGGGDSSVSSAYACCGTPPEAAECCSEGNAGGGFGWWNASIVNFEVTPRMLDASSAVSTTTSVPARGLDGSQVRMLTHTSSRLAKTS